MLRIGGWTFLNWFTIVWDLMVYVLYCVKRPPPLFMSVHIVCLLLAWGLLSTLIALGPFLRLEWWSSAWHFLLCFLKLDEMSRVVLIQTTNDWPPSIVCKSLRRIDVTLIENLSFHDRLIPILESINFIIKAFKWPWSLANDQWMHWILYGVKLINNTASETKDDLNVINVLLKTELF